MTGRVREEIIARLGLDPAAERLDLGQSNHTWIGPDYVLRLSAVPGGRTLIREAATVRCLPESVGYPEVLGDGIVAGFDWMVMARLPGDNLDRRWPDLTPEQRVAAVTDLWQRLERVHDTDLDRLPRLPWTPLYAFDREVRSAQLAAATAVLGLATTEVLERLIERGLERAAGEPRVLVHTDAGPHNTVWDGRRAVPIDFEFCCVGPADLDLEHLAGEVMRSGDPTVIEEFRRLIGPRLAEPGAIDRLRCYAILYPLWALTKWIANDPDSTEKATWQPALEPTRSPATGSNGCGHEDRGHMSTVSKVASIGGESPRVRSFTGGHRPRPGGSRHWSRNAPRNGRAGSKSRHRSRNAPRHGRLGGESRHRSRNAPRHGRLGGESRHRSRNATPNTVSVP